MDSIRNLRFSIAILVLVIGCGTVGYSLIEGWTPFDSYNFV